MASVKQLKFTPAVGATSISRRTYLAESEFIVRATLDGHTEEIDQAFASPVFSVYLGRKAFPAARGALRDPRLLPQRVEAAQRCAGSLAQ